MDKIEKWKKIVFTGILLFLIFILIAYLIDFYLKRKTQLSITSEPDKITVVVNNKGYQTPAIIKGVKPGSTRIEAYTDGYQFQVRYIDIKKGKLNQLQILLEKDTESQPTEGAPTEPEPTPQIKNLPYITDHFRISWDSAYNKYLIVPSIPFIPDQSPEDRLAQNWQQYESRGIEAIAWLKKQGVKPTKDNIDWWMQEFWPEGKSIIY